MSKDKKNVIYSKKMKDEVEKNPVGRRVQFHNNKGELVEPRKLHLKASEFEIYRTRWLADCIDISAVIKVKAGLVFFNPYRHAGPYYGGVQALFRLGANEWHRDKLVEEEMEKVMMQILDKFKEPIWKKFADRERRSHSVMAKDLRGRIYQNFRVLQRLGGSTPYAYKLKQVLTCIDIKPDDVNGWYFKLNTEHDKEIEVVPLYISRKFNKGRKPEAKPVSVEPVVDKVS